MNNFAVGKNVYLGPLRPTPNESSNQEAFKLDKIPDKKDLMATY